MQITNRLILLLISIFLCSQVLAEVYKWVDENGKVHFSDQPQQGAQQIQVNTKSVVHSSSGPSTREINRRISAVNQQLAVDRLQQQNAKAREERSAQVRKKSSEKNCQYYKDKLDNLEYEWGLKTTRKGYRQSAKDKYLTKKDRYQRDIARTCR